MSAERPRLQNASCAFFGMEQNHCTRKWSALIAVELVSTALQSNGCTVQVGRGAMIPVAEIAGSVLVLDVLL